MCICLSTGSVDTCVNVNVCALCMLGGNSLRSIIALFNRGRHAHKDDESAILEM